MKIGPFDITRGALIPYSVKARRRQKRNEAGDGAVVVSDPGWSAKYFSVRITVTVDEARLIQGYLIDGARGSANVITLVDDYGVTRSVRYWGDDVTTKAIASGLYEMELTFRQEVS